MITKKLPSFMALAALTAGNMLTSAWAAKLAPVQPGDTTFPNFISIPWVGVAVVEGVAVDKVGNVLFGVSGAPDQIWQISPAGVPSLRADLPTVWGGLAGLAVDASGDVYVVDNGVYRAEQNGTVTLVPGTENIAAPNALAFDQRGTLYITESYSYEDPVCMDLFGQGGIWRVPKGGTAELWIRDDLLTGTCPPSLIYPVPYGANGIAFYHGDLYVANSEKALIVRIPVQPDGSPGLPEVWHHVQDVPTSPFHGYWLAAVPDGLAMDVHGNVYAAVPTRAAIIRINAADRSQETIAVFPDALLDIPLSLAFGTGSGDRQGLFITNGGFSQWFAPGLAWPGQGLTRLEVGVPGLPLP